MSKEKTILLIVLLVAAAFLVWDYMNGGGLMPNSGMPIAGMNFGNIPDAKVYSLANAIATAEGFYVSGSIPSAANNPGDLVLGDIGNGTLGAGITVYATAAQGWEALYNQCYLMLSGESENYSPAQSITQVSQKYTSTQQVEWAANVSSVLGISPDTTLGDWLNT